MPLRRAPRWLPLVLLAAGCAAQSELQLDSTGELPLPPGNTSPAPGVSGAGGAAGAGGIPGAAGYPASQGGAGQAPGSAGQAPGAAGQAPGAAGQSGAGPAGGGGGQAGAAGGGAHAGSAGGGASGASGAGGGASGASGASGGASGSGGAPTKLPTSGCEGTGLQKGSPWPMLHRCPTHRSRADAITPTEHKVRWEVASQDGLGYINSPVLGADGTVYVGGRSLFAFNSSGEQLWAFPSPTQFDATPAIGADGTLYVGDEVNYGPEVPVESRFYAIRPDGTLRWSITLSGEGLWSSTTIGPGGVIYVGGPTARLYALSSEGDVLWSRPSGHIDHGNAPAIGLDGTLYVANTQGQLLAFRPDGEPLWVHDGAQSGYWQPLVGDDGTIFTAANSTLLNFDPTGKLRWSYEAEQLSFLTSQRHDGSILIAKLHELRALGPDGSVLWARPIPNVNVAGASIGADDRAIVNFGAVASVDQEGKPEWGDKMLPDGTSTSLSPAIGADGAVYVSTQARLVVFEP